MTERTCLVDLGVVMAPQAFSQLGILVLDGSGSMADLAEGKISKAHAVDGAVREMLTRFMVSRYKQNFSFAVVAFDDHASVHTPITSAVDIDDRANYDPMRNHGGGTNIGAGLREAWRIAKEFLRTTPEDIPASVVIVVMSDGLDGAPDRTLHLAKEIKSNPEIMICTTYFAQIGAVEQEAQDHLRALATHPTTDFGTVYDAETLRKFFITSVSARTNFLMA